jgi:hypothetical protein
MRATLSKGLLVAVVALSACVVGSGDETPGRISAVVEASTAAYTLTRVTVAVDGGDPIDLAYRSSDASFAGTILAPVGLRTVTATAYAGAVLVATGSANVAVEPNTVASVTLRLLDGTGPAPAPDHGPIVTSISVSNVAPRSGDAVDVAATAIDPDGDPITWSWSATCTPGPSGSFASPSAASTVWTAAAPGACTLTATALARGLGASLSAHVVVQQFTGLTGGTGGAP